MNIGTNKELAEFLHQVPFDDLKQYFKDRGITPPGDGSKEAYIRFLLENTEYKPDARVAVLLELRNAARVLRTEITDATAELKGTISKATTELKGRIDEVDKERQKLSEELNKEVRGVKTLTQIYVVATGVIGLAVTAAGVFGVVTLADLQTNSTNASEKVKSVGTLVDAYKAHLQRVALEDLAAVMNGASTRWFADLDTPTGGRVNGDVKLIDALRSIPVETSQKAPASGLSLADALALQFNLIQRVLNVKSAAMDYNTIVMDWEGVRDKIKRAKMDGMEDEQKRFLAYINNVLGIALYARYNAEAATRPKSNDLDDAESRFREAIDYDKYYSPASSNLAALLLDRIEREVKGAKGADRKVLAERFAEPESLLSNALRYEQPARTTSRIHNNLAYSRLQRALLLGEARSFALALKEVDAALQWAELGLARENPAAVLAGTKAEVTAYKAYLLDELGSKEKSGSLVEEALKLLKEATARGYRFEGKDADGLFNSSPSLAKFVERFGRRKGDVLAAAGVTT